MATGEACEEAVANGNVIASCAFSSRFLMENQQLEAEETSRNLRQRDRSLATHLEYFQEKLRNSEFLDCALSENGLMNYASS